ncbi:MAG: DUF2243 domain-containing protein [Alphaproteobacteria bacterium]|nr:DUF2243 domain-containing protein [Alphaproteobacteria bacterium]
MSDRIWTASAVTSGFALGGFFDGVLLHQILQWHHLLSLVPGVSDLRQQVLWDGYFHAAMYLLAVLGLIGLWRRRQLAAPGRILLALLLIGFGLWHAIDAVLSHWILGIHRIRVDSATPLLWDLLWLAAFGLLPLAVGLAMQRGGGGRGPSGRAGTAQPVLLLALASLGLGGWALRVPDDMPLTAIVFRAGMAPEQVASVLQDAGATVVWSDPGMGIVLVDMEARNRRDLYRQGALLVGGSVVPAGCFTWSRT